jgi:hypothetical protein
MSDEDGSETVDDPDAEPPGETVPEVELSLYQVTVRVKGQGDDSLDDVEDSARDLIDHLVDHAQTLEDSPDGRGLG